MAYPIPANAPDPTQVMGRRIGAFIIDLIIGLALIAGVSRLTIEFVLYEDLDLCKSTEARDIFGGEEPSADATICTLPGNRMVFIGNGDSQVLNQEDTSWLLLPAILYGLIVLVGIQGLTGATPGKAMFGVRTVNEAGGKPGIGRALVRWLLWIIDWFPYCCLPLVGGICALSTKGHKRVGDMVAKTYVIDRASRGQPVMFAGQPGTVTEWSPPGGAAPPGAVPGAPPMPGAASEPTWDPQRNRYVQYDQATGRWLGYDDTTNEWKPVE